MPDQRCEYCRLWKERPRMQNPRRIGDCLLVPSVPESVIMTVCPTRPDEGQKCSYYQPRYPS